jgi:hypothetical protein
LLAMKGWHKLGLRLFRGQPQVLTGCDTGQARDSRVRDAVPHGNDAPVGAEAGQVSPGRRDAFTGPVRVREVMRKRRKGGAPHPPCERVIRIIAMARASVPRRQAQPRSQLNPLLRPCRELRRACHAGRPWQPVPAATEADGLRTGLPGNRNPAPAAGLHPR